MDHLQLPDANHYTLVNATVCRPDNPAGARFDRTSLSVRNGMIVDELSSVAIDLRGGMVFPCPVDMHTHLDKGHISPRAQNPDGTFASALQTVHDNRTRMWTAEDVRRRMDFALRCAHAHGTRAIRTHLDSLPPQHGISWPVFDEMRSEWRGRIALQAVSIFGIDLVGDSPDFQDVVATVRQYGGTLGCVTYPCPYLEWRLEYLFRCASENGLDLDLHVDETDDPGSASLRVIAETSLRNGFEGTVVAGHCCSLARQDEEAAARTIRLLSEAGMAVVSLPMCNMYLQDRRMGRTPRWRGITLVKEMDAAGIPVSFASDNTRDPFFAYGDLDMIEVMREATRICHLDHSDDSWLTAFCHRPATICGFGANHLLPGDEADFILFRARDMSELLSRPQMDRVVVRGGRAIDRSLPDYSELDDLMETT